MPERFNELLGCDFERDEIPRHYGKNLSHRDRHRIDTLAKCCIGSRAAFARLLADRQGLSDEELLAILSRLDEVVNAGMIDSESSI